MGDLLGACAAKAAAPAQKTTKKYMKKPSFRKSAHLLAVGMALTFASAAHALTFNYASEPNAAIVFNGAGGFTFTGASNNFQVTSGTANGLLGEITGAYTIGAITTVGSTSTAPVSGSGTFVIHDGANNLTGTLTWVNISQTGTAGGLNTVGSVNLTGITYGGSNADLVALKNNATAYNVLTFQFVPAVSLTTLATTSASTSFSGTITTNVPEGGTTLLLLGIALAALALVPRKHLA